VRVFVTAGGRQGGGLISSELYVCSLFEDGVNNVIIRMQNSYQFETSFDKDGEEWCVVLTSCRLSHYVRKE
jgi:hypothetical protein